ARRRRSRQRPPSAPAWRSASAPPLRACPRVEASTRPSPPAPRRRPPCGAGAAPRGRPSGGPPRCGWEPPPRPRRAGGGRRSRRRRAAAAWPWRWRRCAARPPASRGPRGGSKKTGIE
ncbi:unnamed protein product, partial [Prorocentrum cordatum]